MVYGAGSRVEASPFLYLAIVAIQLVMALWSFILLVKTTAEVHRFSAWRGLATVLIPGIVIFVLLFACVVAVSSVTITP